jgi:hypothetical protein
MQKPFHRGRVGDNPAAAWVVRRAKTYVRIWAGGVAYGSARRRLLCARAWARRAETPQITPPGNESLDLGAFLLTTEPGSASLPPAGVGLMLDVAITRRLLHGPAS